MTPKRSRGRPKGSGIDDEADLQAIADRILASDRLRPTTAMRQRYRSLPGRTDSEEAAVHRWGEKWRSQKHRLMAEALARREARRITEAEIARPAAVGPTGRDPLAGLPLSPGLSAYQQMLDQQQRLQDLIDPPMMRRIREMIEGPAFRAVTDHLNSPTYRAIRDVVDSPTYRAILDDLNSPISRIARGLDPFGRR